MGHRKVSVGSRLSHASWMVMALLGAVAFSLGIVTVAHAQVESSAASGTRSYEVPVSSPEGVYYDSGTRAFYGGSAVDGEIYKAKLDGARLEKARTFMAPAQDATGALDTRTGAHGLNVDEKGRLYIAGVASGQLHVYQLPRGNKVATFDTGAGGYINDVDFAPNGDVYFTDSLRPTIWRVTAEQVAAGSGQPQAIPLAPEVDYGKATRTNNPLEVNGIRFTPNGKYIIFGSLNNGELYRMTPARNPEDRRIVKVGGITPAQLGNTDGLEFLDGTTLYSVDNSGTALQTPGSFDETPERIVKLRFSDSYTTARVLNVTTSPEFHTPATITLAPNDRVLVSNLELFEPDLENPDPTTSFVTSLRRP